MGVPHFCSDFIACLYHKYLSLNIEQLFKVFEGTDEQPGIIIIIINNNLIFEKKLIINNYSFIYQIILKDK